MTNSPNIIYSICFISLPLYGVLVAYYAAKIMQKTGESERFWFFVILFFNVWAFVIILLRPSFREGLNRSDIRKLILFAIGYVVLFPLLLFFLETV